MTFYWSVLGMFGHALANILVNISHTKTPLGAFEN
jgi:hypothetical protein